MHIILNLKSSVFRDDRKVIDLLNFSNWKDGKESRENEHIQMDIEKWMDHLFTALLRDFTKLRSFSVYLGPSKTSSFILSKGPQDLTNFMDRVYYFT